jgi:DNA-binding NtrC family response regulator
MDVKIDKYKGMKVLVVDDEEQMCFLLKRTFEKHGLTAIVSQDGESALDRFRKDEPDVVVLDILMPGLDGRETMQQMRQSNPEIPIIFMTGLAGVSGAVEAMKSGAFDYIAKPFELNEMLEVVVRGLEERLGRRRYSGMSEERRQQQDEMLSRMGSSDVILELASVVKRVARTQFDVLITGERGGGKSIVAQMLHHNSVRVQQPFIEVACDAQKETLLERELFGYEAGAFPEAATMQPSLFEKAYGGTLYIEEISAMPLSLQGKFLHTLQNRAVLRMGAETAIPTDVRVVCSSSRDLIGMMEEKNFRVDLYYRLNEYSIHVPALRERKTDIPYLASRFIQQANKELNKDVTGFTPKALDKLMAYHWPSNVSQLRAVVRRAVLFAEDFISAEQLDLETASDRHSGIVMAPELEEIDMEHGLSLKDHVRKHTSQIERQILLETLKRTGWNKAKASRILQIDYKTMQTKVKEYKLQDPEQ